MLKSKLFTGCIVPPATITALASLTILVKWTAGFRSRNFRLEQLSRSDVKNTGYAATQ